MVLTSLVEEHIAIIAKNHRIAVTRKPLFPDPEARKIRQAIKEFLLEDVEEVAIWRIYSLNKDLSDKEINAIANGPLVDPILEHSFSDESIEKKYDWAIEVGFKNGVTDNAGKTAQIAIEDFLGVSFSSAECVKTSIKYLLKGNISPDNIGIIARDLLGNVLIEDIAIRHLRHGETINHPAVEVINIQLNDHGLETLSKQRQLALNLQEMQTIRDHYARPDIKEERKKHLLPGNPTDVELEALAQTWSEHCKHKIFAAKICYKEDGHTETIDSLFSTYIKQATKEIGQKINWLVSVFTDNAGIIRFNDTYNLAFKVETHNSPSALDPYGGALTGILGVNRDVLGAGRGARLVANTNIFCFAPPNYRKAIPPRLMHPKRIFEGVRRGVEHGGNKSGVPTVNGAIVFDERFLGKPLVYCGTIGMMPAKLHGQETHLKEILPGDLIVIAGGRTGKDGIHGATFSSEELHANSPSSAVQIGDPFTQKKLHDFLIDARDAGLYRTLTDNGAGGFSSSVGELSQLSGGCEIHLEKALLKYPGLKPWEILLSESQERMTLAVSSEHYEALTKLADLHEVEIQILGTFNNSGNFHILHNQMTVACLSLEFLHHGVPQLNLEAEWISKPNKPLQISDQNSYTSDLHQLLSRYNVCSKEPVIRQYDHEVQGGSVIKPLMGKHNDGPSDAAIIRPLELLRHGEKSKEAICVSNGICPRYSDIDTYHMTACALDEALRNLVATGCDPSSIAILDNFCWPDPIYDANKTPDGKYKLAQLVRANKALYDYAIAFGTPIISGKDSMKNDYKIDNIKISIPPTLLISAIGKIPDVEKAISMDVKQAGDFVYIIGMTFNELGASEYCQMKEMQGGEVPKVNAATALKCYQALYGAIQQELIASCHDCSDGGMAVALAEKAFSGGHGMDIDLQKIPQEGIHHDAELLFSESSSRLVATIAPMYASAFEKCFAGLPCARIGEVRADGKFCILGLHGDTIIHDEISKLKHAWQHPLIQGGTL